MDPATFSAVVGAGANVATNFGNQFINQHMYKNAQQFQLFMTDYANDLNRANVEQAQRYNSYVNQVAQMRQAGLNPALLYKGSNFTPTAPVAVSSGGAPAPPYATPFASPADFSQLAKVGAETSAINAQTNLTKSQSDNVQLLSQYQQIVNNYADNKERLSVSQMESILKEIDSKILLNSANTALSFSNIRLTDAQVEQANATIEKLNAEVSKLAVETKLAVPLFELQRAGTFSTIAMNNASISNIAKNNAILALTLQKMRDTYQFDVNKSFYESQQARTILNNLALYGLNLGEDFKGKFLNNNLLFPIMYGSALTKYNMLKKDEYWQTFERFFGYYKDLLNLGAKAGHAVGSVASAGMMP